MVQKWRETKGQIKIQMWNVGMDFNGLEDENEDENTPSEKKDPQIKLNGLFH